MVHVRGHAEEVRDEEQSEASGRREGEVLAQSDLRRGAQRTVDPGVLPAEEDQGESVLCLAAGVEAS